MPSATTFTTRAAAYRPITFSIKHALGGLPGSCVVYGFFLLLSILRVGRDALDSTSVALVHAASALAMQAFWKLRRWGTEAITRRNVLMVTAVVGASAAALAWNEASDVLQRAVLLGAAIFALAALLRERSGRLLSITSPLFVLARGLRGDAYTGKGYQADKVWPA